MSQLGPCGKAEDHYAFWLRDSDDLIGVFGGEEALRVRSDGTAILRFPKGSWTPFVDRFGTRFGIISIQKNKTMSKGVVLQVQIGEDTIQVADGKLIGDYKFSSTYGAIDYRGSWVPRPPAAVKTRAVDKERLAKRVAEIKDQWKVHCVTARLQNFDTEKTSWSNLVQGDWTTDQVTRLQRLEFKDFAYFVSQGRYHERSELAGWNKVFDAALKRNKAELCGRENLYL